MTREMPRYSSDADMRLSRELFEHYRLKTREEPPVIPGRHVRESYYSAGYRSSTSSSSSLGKPHARKHAAATTVSAGLWNRVQSCAEEFKEPDAYTCDIVVEPFVPDDEAVAFVREERLKIPRTFDPAVHDTGPDAKADPGIARSAFPLFVDDLVYLKTSEGDHDYYTRLPAEEGPELRARSKVTGRSSVSGLVATLKRPFDEKAQSQKSAEKRLKALADHFKKPLDVIQAAVDTASPEELREWTAIADGGFTPEWFIMEWKRRADLGTDIHRALELYLNGKQSLEDAQEQQNGAMRDALRKFKELVGAAKKKRELLAAKRRAGKRIDLQDIPTPHEKLFETFTPENVCRTELSLCYEPYDIVGQLDALFWVDRAKRTVVLVDWKGIDAESESAIRAKLKEYEPQLMLYTWLMKNAPAPPIGFEGIDVRTLTVVGMILVALPPTQRSGTNCAMFHEVVYNPMVVQGLLDTRRNELHISLRKRLRLLERTHASAELPEEEEEEDEESTNKRACVEEEVNLGRRLF